MKPPLEEICCLRCIATGKYLCYDKHVLVRQWVTVCPPSSRFRILYGTHTEVSEFLKNLYDFENDCYFELKDFEVITYFERSYAKEMYQPEPIKPKGIFEA